MQRVPTQLDICVSILECFHTPTILLDIGDVLTEVMNFRSLGLECDRVKSMQDSEGETLGLVCFDIDTQVI